MNKIFTYIVIIAYMSACSFDDSDDMRNGYIHYKIGEDKLALKMLEPIAHRSSRAAFIVGKIYEKSSDNLGEDKLLKAEKYYRISADLGNKSAEYRLALLRVKDGDESGLATLKRLAAEKNVEASLIMFELEYTEGNYSAAIKHLDDIKNKNLFGNFLHNVYTQDALSDVKRMREMAKSGNAESALGFANLLMQNPNKPLFPYKARYWYSLASAESEEAKYKLAELYALGVGGQMKCDEALSLLGDVIDKDNQEFRRISKSVVNVCVNAD